MASNSRVSSGKASKALIVEFKFALLHSAKKRNNIFVKMEIIDDQEPRHQKLETTMANTMADMFAYWNQKFIFSLPSCCYSPEKSSGACISFRVCLKQKYFPDTLLGVAKCNFLDLLSQLGDDDSMKSSMNLEISKGEVSVGLLSVEVKRKYLRCIGNSRQNFAMDYDEFMMLEKPAAMETKKKIKKKQQRPRTSPLMWFRNTGD